MADQVLNAEGRTGDPARCFRPDRLSAMNSGEVLEVRATDPGSVADFAAFCKQTGNDLLSSTTEGDIYKFEIKVS